MFKNVASQKVYVFAFDLTTTLPVTGDAANITGSLAKDFGADAAITDTNPSEIDDTTMPGYYAFDLTQAESNADTILIAAVSSTSDVMVIGAPAVIFTFPTTGILAPATAGRTLVVDASGLADANMVKAGPTGSGTAQTAGDIYGKVGALPSDPADQSLIIAATDAIVTLIGTPDVSLAADIAGVPDAVGARQITEGYAVNGVAPTLDEALSMLIARKLNFDIVGDTLTIYGLDGTTPVMTLDIGAAPHSECFRAT